MHIQWAPDTGMSARTAALMADFSSPFARVTGPFALDRCIRPTLGRNHLRPTRTPPDETKWNFYASFLTQVSETSML